jgi:hypothetical protein
VMENYVISTQIFPHPTNPSLPNTNDFAPKVPHHKIAIRVNPGLARKSKKKKKVPTALYVTPHAHGPLMQQNLAALTSHQLFHMKICSRKSKLIFFLVYYITNRNIAIRVIFFSGIIFPNCIVCILRRAALTQKMHWVYPQERNYTHTPTGSSFPSPLDPTVAANFFFCISNT